MTTSRHGTEGPAAEAGPSVVPLTLLLGASAAFYVLATLLSALAAGAGVPEILFSLAIPVAGYVLVAGGLYAGADWARWAGTVFAVVGMIGMIATVLGLVEAQGLSWVSGGTILGYWVASGAWIREAFRPRTIAALRGRR
ncbi:MAG: hypothetical protein Q4G34_06310 [Micrococcus sp.]|nr:hypothetical protein [Micrococcus sp.]